MAFQGSLKELPLPDIIQLVSVSGKTGKFTLSREHERGFIYLKNGQMVHAFVGDLIAEEAIYALDIWNAGEFQFNPGEEPDRQTITKSNTNLLMEAARRLDEWRVLSKKIPSVEYVPELLAREKLRHVFDRRNLLRQHAPLVESPRRFHQQIRVRLRDRLTIGLRARLELKIALIPDR